MAAFSSPRNLLVQLALLFARLALGFYFAYAGWAKVRGEFANGLGSFARGAFKTMQPAWLPDLIAAPYGYALPWIELILGLLLMLGLFGGVVALLTALVMLSIIVALFFAGQLLVFQGKFASSGPYHANMVYLSLALLLALFGPGRFSVDALWRKRVSHTTS